MKISEIITNLNTENPEWEDSLQKNFSVLRDEAVSVGFERKVGPGQIISSTGNRYLASGFFDIPVLADAATNYCSFAFPRPRTWNDGQIGFRWILSGETSSNHNAVLKYYVGAQKLSDVIDPSGNFTSTYSYFGSTTTDGSTELVNGPATAFTCVQVESGFKGYCAIDASIDYIIARIDRYGADASDDYVGDFYVVGAMLRYFPKRHQG